VYEYTKNQNYSFAPFRGIEFIEDYIKSRKSSMKKPIIKNNEMDIKATRSRLCLNDYDMNGDLKALNTALKINDEICSNDKITQISQNTLYFELELIFELLDKEKLL